jgi:hypothetical protein
MLLDYQRSSYYYRQAAAAFPVPGVTGPVGGANVPEVVVRPGFGSDDYMRVKCRRNRTVFTDHHLTSLERNFERQKYLSTKDRAQLAAQLGLSQIQVKTWYQNRRMKWKKQVLCSYGFSIPTPTYPSNSERVTTPFASSFTLFPPLM